MNFLTGLREESKKSKYSTILRKARSQQVPERRRVGLRRGERRPRRRRRRRGEDDARGCEEQERQRGRGGEYRGRGVDLEVGGCRSLAGKLRFLNHRLFASTLNNRCVVKLFVWPCTCGSKLEVGIYDACSSIILEEEFWRLCRHICRLE